MAIWDGMIPESDLTRYARAGSGGFNGAGEHPALLVVDTTNSYMDPRYPMSVIDGETTTRAIGRLLDLARARGIPVIYTTGRSWLYPSDRGRWKSSGPDIILTAEAAAIPSAIAPREDEQVLVKLRASAFSGTDLLGILNFHHVDTVIVTGVVTSGCVLATAIDAASWNYFVLIPEEAVADRGEMNHKVTLFNIHMKWGDVLPLAQVEAYLEGLPLGDTHNSALVSATRR